MKDQSLFWLLLIGEVAAIIMTDGTVRLLAAAATAGTVYVGSQKGLI